MDGFPPHVVGFMKRRREKENERRSADERPVGSSNDLTPVDSLPSN